MNYILDFLDSMTDTEVTQYASDNNITILKKFDAFGQVYLAASDIEPVVNNSLLSVISNDNNVIDLLSFNVDLVANSETIDVSIDDNKNWWKVASIKNINFDEPEFNHILLGKQCVVYVVDSGIEIDHPEFDGKPIELFHSFTGDFTDTAGHGTAIASVIAGNTCSITNTNVKVVKIFDANVGTTHGDLLEAFNAIINQYELDGRPSSVVNLSWSISRNEYINEKIQIMIDRGLLVFAASGNSGLPIQDVTPACVPSVFTVGSFNQSLTPSDFTGYTDPSIISYTDSENNYGVLDGWAPGEQIWAAGLNGTYGYTAGTSISTAIASAACAYNMGMYLDIPPADVEPMLASYQRNDRINALKGLTFQRDNLLMLGGQYANTTGKIATYISTPNIPNTKNTYYVQAGSKIISLYASPYLYTNVSSVDSLPDGVSITENGYISISSNVMDELYVEMPLIEMSITKKDGTVIPNTIQIVLFTQDKTFQQLVDDEMAAPGGSDLLNIILLSDCNYVGGCAGSCPDPKMTCSDAGGKSCVCTY